nr:hypothetical protein JG2_0210 [uncultured bacterium]
MISNHAQCIVSHAEVELTRSQMNESDYKPTKEEIQKWLRELKNVPEPNCGRIQELKDKIKNKTLITKESIEETAIRLAARFLGKDKNTN